MRFLNILPVVVTVLSLASCSVYRQGQTPDDVYYSPGRAKESYVVADARDDRYASRNDDYYNPDDNYLRMRVRDRYRWSTFDDYSYMNDWQYGGGYYGMYSPYTAYGSGLSFGLGFGSPFFYNNYWNNYYSWNSYYNPYCPGMIVVSPKWNPQSYSNVRNFRLNSYTNNSYNTRNSARSGLMYNSNTYRSTNNNARYSNSNRSNNVGGSLRRVFSNDNARSNNTYYDPGSSRSSNNSSAPVRTYNPSSSSGSYSPSSSSSSGSSRGGGSVGSSNGRSSRN